MFVHIEIVKKIVAKKKGEEAFRLLKFNGRGLIFLGRLST